MAETQFDLVGGSLEQRPPEDDKRGGHDGDDSTIDRIRSLSRFRRIRPHPARRTFSKQAFVGGAA